MTSEGSQLRVGDSEPFRLGPPQLTALFTSAQISPSSAAVNSCSAKAVGHMWPSSRFALSLKPSVAYLALNCCALWKQRSTLPSLHTPAARIRFSARGLARWLGDGMKPLGHSAIRFLHLGDLRARRFPRRFVRARAATRSRFQPLSALPHRALFLVR